MSPAQSVRRVLHLCPDPHYLTELYELYRQALDRPPFEHADVSARSAEAGLQTQLGPRVHFLDLPRQALEGFVCRRCGGCGGPAPGNAST